MKLATRINSFFTDGRTLIDVLDRLGAIEGLTHVDLNYPEHFIGQDLEEVKKALQRNNLKVNGLALRFRDQFKNGELGNSDAKIAAEAKQLCFEAVDLTKELGGSQITIWLGYDGFDYPFQLDYAKAWNQVVEAIKEIADHDPSIMVSIEYKPYEPRTFALVGDIGTTLLLIHDVNRPNVGLTLDYCHMKMKHENPAYSLVLAAEKNLLFGVHLNDGYGVTDDGLMVGSVGFIQTLEFLYYVKKYRYDGTIYFDTFPVREEAVAECTTNIKLLNRFMSLIDKVGMDTIDAIVSKNDAIAAQEILLKCLA
ncbi:MAG: sugar phosphate isomerase/epimerase [Firmicutes bacterium]|nr:sugar phosphate isomerase/epimerase [Bacillota bacterium]